MNYKKIIILVLLMFGLFTAFGCKKQKYEVVFDTDGGTKINTVTVNEGEKVTKPDDPTKEGYIFENWYKDTNRKELFSFDEVITENTTVYAKWLEMEKFTVKFETNGGTEIADMVVYGGSTLGKIATTTKVGFSFAGWFTDKELTTEFDLETKINKDMTLYAKWDDRIITVVIGISRPSYYNAFLNNKKEKENKKTEFFDLTKEFKVGDDNAWNVYPDVTFSEINLDTLDQNPVTVDSWEFEINIYELFDGSETKLDKDSDLIDSIDYIKCLVDFSEKAIGKKFRVEIIPTGLTAKQKENIAKYTVKLEGTVTDGYNVTNAKELSYIDNRSAIDYLKNRESAEEKAWDEFKTTYELDKNLHPKNLIIHNDITLTKDDLPGLFFYKEEEVSKADADYDRVIGSMKDFYDFYHHYVLENDEFHIYGNYYTINSKSLKEVVRESGKITPEGEVISHATLIRFGGAATGNTSIEDTNLVGNAPKVENVVKSGGQILIKVEGPVFNARNNIASCYFITYFPNYTFTNFTMEKCKVYDGFNCFVYNWGSPLVTIKECEMIGAGGPIIIQDHVDSQASDGGKLGKTVVINSRLESFVTGQEGWFSVVKASALVPSIKALDNIFNTVNRSFLKKGNDAETTLTYMNLICVNKSGSAQGLTAEKIKGSLKIDDGAAFDFGETNPYLAQMLETTFTAGAPAFQSSNATLEKGYGYTDSKALYDVTGAPITDPTNPIFSGDYICIYYQGMCFTLGFYDMGEVYNPASLD